MKTRIKENLSRQAKAMLLLKTLLEEEFARLMENKPQSVSRLELSIQELLRQVVSERKDVRALVGRFLPGGVRVRDMVRDLADAEAEEFNRLLQEIDRLEQLCAVQANKNQQLAMALMDQSNRLLGYLHKQVQPKEKNNTYSAKGRYAASRTPAGALLLNGRF